MRWLVQSITRDIFYIISCCNFRYCFEYWHQSHWLLLISVCTTCVTYCFTLYTQLVMRREPKAPIDWMKSDSSVPNRSLLSSSRKLRRYDMTFSLQRHFPVHQSRKTLDADVTGTNLETNSSHWCDIIRLFSCNLVPSQKLCMADSGEIFSSQTKGYPSGDNRWDIYILIHRNSADNLTQ